jgi:hypothetical protein
VTRRLKHPDTGREIGGGRFFVNATGIFTRSLGAARFLPLPSPSRLSECPRRSRAGAWSPDRGMAGQICRECAASSFGGPSRKSWLTLRHNAKGSYSAIMPKDHIPP